MKKFSLIVFVLALLLFFACTADYDTFGTSDYRSLDGIALLEQDGSPALYSDEHRLVFSLLPPPDSLGTWDSVTVEDIDISHFASLHLVESKFKVFPSDSASLDSLARSVVFEKKPIRKRRRLRIPASQNFYVVVLSESGEPSIWQWSFKIPGVEPAMSSGEQAPASSSSGNSSGTSSGATSSSSSGKALSSENALGFLFDGQIRLDTIGDTLLVKLASGTELDSLVLKSWSVSAGAKVSPNPDSVKAWRETQTFTVTAEDGAERIWTLRFSKAGLTDVLYLSAKNQKKSLIDEVKKTVTLYFESSEDLGNVEIDSLLLSDGATSDLSLSGLDLNSEKTFTVSTESSSATWKLFGLVAASPKILSQRIAGMDASIDTVSNIIHLDTLPFLADLANLELSDIVFSEGAFCDEVEVGAKLDLSLGMRVAVKNALDETSHYEIRAGYQLPNSDLDVWKGDDPLPDSIWNNANTILTTTKKYMSGSTIGAEITTGSAVGKIASGSLYTADFNPKGVGTLSMANSSTWPDGNELLDFGKPFRARPRFFEVKFQYKGQNNDSCDMYVLLENRTGDKNVNRTKTDVNKLVASAWYRSSTADNSGRPNPDVVEISSPDAQGFRTVRMKLQYGIPLAGSPIENSSTFTTTLQSKDERAINNGLVQGSGDEPVTHIRVVFASSAAGNRYVGVKNSKLVIDELRLVY